MDEPETLNGDAALLWTAAQALARAAAPVSDQFKAASRRPVPPLLFFTDPARTPRPWEIAERLPAEAGVVYRTFGATDAFDTARRLRDITTERGVALLIGLDADLADRVGADGVHLPERALSAAYALSGRRPDWTITGAVHSVEAASKARDLDAAVLSPIFPAGGASGTKANLGLQVLSQAVRQARCPIIALGGIEVGNVGALSGTGVSGIATIGAIARAFGL